MSVLPVMGVHHLRLTVTDLARSRDFYERVLGFPVAVASDADPTDPVVRTDPDRLYGGVLLSANGMLFGLRPVAEPGTRFNADAVGLDHISFAVSSRDDLTAAVESLDAEGVSHGQIRDLEAFGIAILSVDDPDGIHLELTSPM